MTIETLLKDDSDIPMSEKEILLGLVLKQRREWILSNNSEEISTKKVSSYKDMVERRRNREPIAYIAGVKEFYRRDFAVNRTVLIPRPATEGLIDLTKRFVGTGTDETAEVDTGIVASAKAFDDVSGAKTIVDVGTGSGCIAVTLALEMPEYKFVAVDICKRALNVAKKNAEAHNVANKIEFLQGNLLDPVHDLNEPFIIVSNPPYIPSTEELMNDVEHFEPKKALRGGVNGNEIVKELITQAENHPYCKGIVLECKEGQIA